MDKKTGGEGKEVQPSSQCQLTQKFYPMSHSTLGSGHNALGAANLCGKCWPSFRNFFPTCDGRTFQLVRSGNVKHSHFNGYH